MEDQKRVEEMNQQELSKLFTGNGIIVQSDIPAEQREEIKDLIQTGIEQHLAPVLNVEASCQAIKHQLDKKYGPTWQVIMGQGYAYDVTVQNNSLLFMYYNGNIAVLVFKS